MPTENELKYVLDLKVADHLVGHPVRIQQGYIYADDTWNLRLRRSAGNRFQMTFKYRVGSRLVEIENDITERDFRDLWSQTTNRLVKDRYSYHGVAGTIWDVDLFRDSEESVYFALAEHEMPEGQLEPQSIPMVIGKHMLYAVPPSEYTDYSSTKLGDIMYAVGKLEEICKTYRTP